MSCRAAWGLCVATGLLASNSAAQSPARADTTNAPPSSITSRALPPGAIDELKRRAAAGDADAEQMLGMAYYYGQIVAQDYQQAFAWALKAATQGNTEASFNVAYMYLNGQGTKKDPAAGFQLYLKLANRGLPNAQSRVGECFAYGIGTTKDLTQSFAWYQKAAMQGDGPAENVIGNCYFQGVGVRKDLNLAFGWYIKAANQNVALAQLAVGEGYFYGNGTTTDPVRAVAWYQKAAIQGNNEAMIRLGICYLNGTGTPVDLKKGFTYLMKAAGTNGYAAYWVAYCYSKGLFVSRDPVWAYAWGLHASAMTKSDDLSKFMAWLKPTLTPDQLRQGEGLLSELERMINGQVQPLDTGFSFLKGKSSLISFEDASGFILIPVQTQDKAPAFLMFDTGSDCSMLSDRFAAEMGLKANTYIPVSGIGASVELGAISDKTDFAIPGVTFHNARWTITPHFDFDIYVGRPVVGILGMDLIENLVVTINFSDHTVEFTQGDAFKAPDATFTCLPLTMREHGLRPMVQATFINNQAEATGPFLIDSGDVGCASLTKFFQDTNPAFKPRPLASSGASGLGGIMRYFTTVCSALVLGEHTLPHPIVDLERDTQGIQASGSGTIGNIIWRRFDLILDFPHQKMYLRKNSHFSDPYHEGSAGMHVVALGTDYKTLTVREVLPDTPAFRAGFQTDDVVVKLDELGSAPLTIDKVYFLLHQPGTYHFTVKRRDQMLPLVLEIKDPLIGNPDAK